MKRSSKLFFIIHLFVFTLICLVMYKTNGFNIFDEIDNFETVMETEIINTANSMYEENKIEKETIQLEIEEYKGVSLNLIKDTTYKLKEHIPALIIIFLIVLINIELYVIDHMKIWISKLTYNKETDTNNRKMKEILKEKLKLKYKRISMPKHFVTVYMFCIILNIIFDFESQIIARTLSNLIFVGTVLITLYGIRLVINFFKSVDGLLKAIIVILNVLMGILYPQFYFFIGFIESIMNVKIVVRKIDK